ncbi:MAG TPA: hypothetical protein VMU15_16850 [Anaeromyxobacter sp.]|nr:hypothetical protein [Anaeromyxobacter sp.]
MRADEKKNGEIPLQARMTGGRDYLELWINLARREWGSLVVIPADRDGSTADIANALADIGQRLSYGPVTAITVTSLEYGSALALADLQQHVERERQNFAQASPVVNVPAEPGPSPEGAAAQGASPAPGTPPTGAPSQDGAVPAQPAEGGNRSQSLVVAPPARLIISVPPVVTEPLGLAAAEEADAVVLAVRMNHSRMADVRRTIELVGRNQITGCFLVR